MWNPFHTRKRFDKKNQEALRKATEVQAGWSAGLKHYFQTPLPDIWQVKDLSLVALDFELSGTDPK